MRARPFLRDGCSPSGAVGSGLRQVGELRGVAKKVLEKRREGCYGFPFDAGSFFSGKATFSLDTFSPSVVYSYLSEFSQLHL